MRRIFDRLDEQKRRELRSNANQLARFFIVGVTAVAIQYGVYLLLVGQLSPAIANTVAYLVSFAFNYVASVRFTFRVKSNARHGAGFVLAHIINYVMQTGLLALFIWMGVEKGLALLPVFAICVPLNFVLVRYFLTR